MDTSEFNSTFWLSCVGLITAFISGTLIYVYKSKCIECNLCFGLINVKSIQIQLIMDNNIIKIW